MDIGMSLTIAPMRAHLRVNWQLASTSSPGSRKAAARRLPCALVGSGALYASLLSGSTHCRHGMSSSSTYVYSFVHMHSF